VTKLTKIQIRTIKVEMGSGIRRRKRDLAEKLSSRLGVDMKSILEKIRELEIERKIDKFTRKIKDH
jgi:hypothetical protein